jgi:UDP-N-acetylmuramyl pentapeptide phosphotransferase/UDP-N-acetylglucosamine-1-phosphate transferase
MTQALLPTWLVAPWLLVAAFAIAAVTAVILVQLVIRGGPVDLPRGRGSHARPTPTSGGMALIGGTAFALGLCVWLWRTAIPGNTHDGLMLFGFAALMGLSGAVDDLFGLPARLRFGFQIILCLIFAWFYRVTDLQLGLGLTVGVPTIIGVVGSAAWLVLGLNAVNFMDGSNGLTLGVQTIALLTIGGLILVMAPVTPLGSALTLTLLICACAAGAHTGLMPFNLPMGAVFQGDAGSMFAGALITGACLQIKAFGAGSAWFGGFLLAPLLVDVVLTLLTRLSQRKDVFRAHREHLYQLWLQFRDPRHGRLALRVWGLCLASGAVGLAGRLLMHFTGLDLRFPALVLVIAVYSAGWMALRRKLLAGSPLKPAVSTS